MINISFCHNIFKSRLQLLSVFRITCTCTLKYVSFIFWMLITTRVHVSFVNSRLFFSIISTLFNYLSIIYRDILYFVLDDFKVCQGKPYWNHYGKKKKRAISTFATILPLALKELSNFSFCHYELKCRLFNIR